MKAFDSEILATNFAAAVFLFATYASWFGAFTPFQGQR